MGGCCGSEQYSGAPRIESEESLDKLYTSLDTGDILLFKSTGAAGCFARCCTNTSWDHVAVVIKRTIEDGPRLGPVPEHACPADKRCDPEYCTCVAEAEDLLEIFEATAAGVHIYGLDDRLAKTVNHHEYMAVLKRNTPPAPEQRQALEQLVLKLRARAYEDIFNGDLCHACCVGCACCEEKGRTNLRESQKFTEEQQQQLFCSELAANCLAALGTLKLATFEGSKDLEGHEARSFLPSDFCDETGGARDIWFESITSDDPYAPMQLLQYPKSPYENFLKKLKKKLWKDHKQLQAQGSGVSPRHHRHYGGTNDSATEV